MGGPRKRRREAEGGTESHPHKCDLCPRAFASWRGLAMHERKVHGKQSNVKCFAGADGTCPVCKCQFRTRLRLIAHLTEKRVRGKTRRPPCGARLQHRHRLSDHIVANLDALDAEQRRRARKAGKTQPVVGRAGLKRHAPAPQPYRRLRCKTTLV